MLVREDLIYTLHLWRDGPKAEDWRASLKDLTSKEVKNFPSLAALCNYLRSSALRP